MPTLMMLRILLYLAQAFAANFVHILREVQLLAHLRHPHIINFVEMFLTDDCIAIVNEYIAGGNLKNFLQACWWQCV